MDAGMVEKALCDFFKSDKENFQIVKESSHISEITRPALSWQASGASFETSESGERIERLHIVCLAVDKNVANEANRRQAAHELADKVIAKINGVSLILGNGERTGIFQIDSWQDATDEAAFEKKLMVVQLEFSMPMPPRSLAGAYTELGNESLKECIRLAAKAILEQPPFNFEIMPTAASFNPVKEKTLAKVAWSGQSEATGVYAQSFMRRRDTLLITIATPNTIEDWQDKTSLLEQKFNFSEISQEAIKEKLPEKYSKSIGNVEVAEINVIESGLPGAYALAKISIPIDYSIQRS